MGPRRGGSNEYPQSLFWAEICKISELLSENFHFLVVKFSVHLNRLVFVMYPQVLFLKLRLLWCTTWTKDPYSTYGYEGPDQPVHITKTCLFKYTENFPTKKWKFSDKNFLYFSYFCSKHRLGYSLEPPRRGGSNEYPQSMFLSRNKKNNVYPCKPQFYYIKVGFKGVKTI